MFLLSSMYEREVTRALDLLLSTWKGKHEYMIDIWQHDAVEQLCYFGIDLSWSSPVIHLFPVLKPMCSFLFFFLIIIIFFFVCDKE